MKIRLLQFIFLCFSVASHAQQVDGFFGGLKERWNNKPVKISGMVSNSTSFYTVSGIPNRQDAFQNLFNAQINFDVLGIQVPFSLIWTDKNSNYNLPSYNFTGASPNYKWVTLHAGHRSMDFSKYTLNNHGFLGAGVELKPGNFRFAAMYGRLKRASSGDINTRQALDPAFKRMGAGMMIGFDNRKHAINLIWFQAWDDELSMDSFSSNQILPANNTVLSLKGRSALSKKIKFEAEYAISAINLDKRADDVLDFNPGLFKKMIGLFNPTITAEYSAAFNAKIILATGKFNLDVQYERIDPGYKSLGTLYFQNNQENLTVGSVFTLFKNKVNMSLRGGIQRDDLANDQATSSLRYLGMGNLNFRISKSVALNASYSNLRNTQRARSFDDPFNTVDSVYFAQVNESAGIGTNWTKTDSAGNTHSLLLFTAFQKSNSILEDTLQADNESSGLNANMAYTFNHKEFKFNLTPAINFNLFETSGLPTIKTISPTLGFNKRLFDEQLTLGSSLSYSQVFSENNSGGILNFRINAGFIFKEKYNLQLDQTLINKTSGEVSPGFTEYQSTIRLSYKFN